MSERSDRDHLISRGQYAVGWCVDNEQGNPGVRSIRHLLELMVEHLLDERDAEVLAAERALAAAGVTQPEPEYEYRLVLELHPPKHAAWDQAETLWYPTAEEARATGKARDWIAHYRIDYPRAKFTERVERRIVAGEPEPAPNQEGQP